jgi:hypothetical protein
MTKNDLLQVIKGVRGTAQLVLEVMDSNGEPYSADITNVFINEIGQIVFTDEVKL